MKHFVLIFPVKCWWLLSFTQVMCVWFSSGWKGLFGFYSYLNKHNCNIYIKVCLQYVLNYNHIWISFVGLKSIEIWNLHHFVNQHHFCQLLTFGSDDSFFLFPRSAVMEMIQSTLHKSILSRYLKNKLICKNQPMCVGDYHINELS